MGAFSVEPGKRTPLKELQKGIDKSLISFSPCKAAVRYVVWNDIDEIPASPNSFNTIAEAKAWREQFLKRFEAQGYYSASSSHWRGMLEGGRIPLSMIKGKPNDFFPIVEQ